MPQSERAPRLVCAVLDTETAGEKARSRYLTNTAGRRPCEGKWLVLPQVSLYKLYFLSSILYNSLTRTDGRRIPPKKPNMTGRASRPVRHQRVWLFAWCVSCFTNGESKSPFQGPPAEECGVLVLVDAAA
jgi:hypothetical protein